MKERREIVRLEDYLDEKDLDYSDVILKKENGEIIESYGCLKRNCQVIKVEGKEITVR